MSARIPWCHPARKHRANGLCKACYEGPRSFMRYRIKRGLAPIGPLPRKHHTSAQPPRKPPRKKRRVKPQCHSERKHFAEGLCKACYHSPVGHHLRKLRTAWAAVHGQRSGLQEGA